MLGDELCRCDGLRARGPDARLRSVGPRSSSIRQSEGGLDGGGASLHCRGSWRCRIGNAGIGAGSSGRCGTGRIGSERAGVAAQSANRCGGGGSRSAAIRTRERTPLRDHPRELRGKRCRCEYRLAARSDGGPAHARRARGEALALPGPGAGATRSGGGGDSTGAGRRRRDRRIYRGRRNAVDRHRQSRGLAHGARSIHRRRQRRGRGRGNVARDDGVTDAENPDPHNPGQCGAVQPADAGPYAMGAPGRALSEAGAGVARVGMDFLQKYDDAQREAQATQTIGEGTRQLSALERKWGQHANAKEAQAGYDAEASKIIDGLTKDIRDIRVKSITSGQLTRESISRSETTFNTAFRLEAETNTAALNVNLASWAREAATNMNVRPVMRDNAWGAIASAQAAGWITPITADKLKNDWMGGVQRATSQHVLNDARTTEDADLAAAKAKNYAQFLDDNPDALDALEPEQREAVIEHVSIVADTLQRQADIQDREDEAAQQAIVRDAYEDNIAHIAFDGTPVTPLSEATIRAHFPAEVADRMISRTQLAISTYHATQDIALQNQDEDAATLAAKYPKGKDAAAQVTAYNVVEKAIND